MLGVSLDSTSNHPYTTPKNTFYHGIVTYYRNNTTHKRIIIQTINDLRKDLFHIYFIYKLRLIKIFCKFLLVNS